MALKGKKEDISSRSRIILGAVVQEYISTGEPVSSKTVAISHLPGLSPATVRNAMAELEELGLLTHPHTSAGRVPTDKGLRLYVDNMVKPLEPEDRAKELIKRSCLQPSAPESKLIETARALAMITQCAGLTFTPGKDALRLKRISLVALDAKGVMALFMFDHGFVETRVVRVDEPREIDLERTTNYLNSIARGLTLLELRSKIIEEMRKEKNLYDELMAGALKLGAMALDNAADGHEGARLHVEGGANMLGGFGKEDLERMKKVFSAFEEKSLLVKLLDRCVDANGARIYFGSESPIEEFDGLCFVMAPCTIDNEVVGSLGVAGPVRMDYSRIIPLVEYTAGFLSKTL